MMLWVRKEGDIILSAWIWEFNWTLCFQPSSFFWRCWHKEFWGKQGLKIEGNFYPEMKDGVTEPRRDKEAGQVPHLSVTFSSLTNPIPNEIRHRDDNTDLSQRCIDASDLSSTGIIIGTWKMWSEDAQGHGECVALLVCHRLTPCLTVTLISVKKGVAVALKEEQSLTVEILLNLNL